MQYRDQIDERDVTPRRLRPHRRADRQAGDPPADPRGRARHDVQRVPGPRGRADHRHRPAVRLALHARAAARARRGAAAARRAGARRALRPRPAHQGDHHRRLEPGEGAVDHRVAALARADPRAVRARGAGDRRRAGRDPERRARARLPLEDRGRLARLRRGPGGRLRGPARLARAHGRVRAARREDRHHPVQRGAGALRREGALARARARGARGRRGQAGHRDRARRPALARDRQGRAERPPGRAADRLARGHPLRDRVRRGGGGDGLRRRRRSPAAAPRSSRTASAARTPRCPARATAACPPTRRSRDQDTDYLVPPEDEGDGEDDGDERRCEEPAVERRSPTAVRGRRSGGRGALVEERRGGRAGRGTSGPAARRGAGGGRGAGARGRPADPEAEAPVEADEPELAERSREEARSRRAAVAAASAAGARCPKSELLRLVRGADGRVRADPAGTGGGARRLRLRQPRVRRQRSARAARWHAPFARR